MASTRKHSSQEGNGEYGRRASHGYFQVKCAVCLRQTMADGGGLRGNSHRKGVRRTASNLQYDGRQRFRHSVGGALKEESGQGGDGRGEAGIDEAPAQL